MLKKNYSKTGGSCRVTFKLTPEAAAAEVSVLGEWNAWDLKDGKMTQRKDGSFSKTVSLDAGNEYRFRYLVNGELWLNDEEADSLVPNRFGSQDGLLTV